MNSTKPTKTKTGKLNNLRDQGQIVSKKCKLGNENLYRLYELLRSQLFSILLVSVPLLIHCFKMKQCINKSWTICKLNDYDKTIEFMFLGINKLMFWARL